MALSKQSLAKTLRSSRNSTKENAEIPALFTRFKKLRSSVNTHEAPTSSYGVSDSASTRQSRKRGSNCDGESGDGDSSPFRQPLTGIHNFAPSASFMTRAMKFRTEQRLAKALNWDSSKIRRISDLLKENVFPTDDVSRPQSSKDSYTPPGNLRTDDDLAVPCEDDLIQTSSPHSWDVFRTSSEVSPSPYKNDGALAVRQEKDVVQNSSPRSCEKPSASSDDSPQDEDVSVTPARRASTRLSTGTLRTPEHLVPALGESVSPGNREAATEGKLRVYERRTGQQLGEKSSRAKTCPQLRSTSTNTTSIRGKGTGSQHYSLRNFKDLFTPPRKVGSGRKKTSSSSSQRSSSMLLPESYLQERCAYFAEVDAFELLEEEADEEEDLGEPTKLKDTVN